VRFVSASIPQQLFAVSHHRVSGVDGGIPLPEPELIIPTCFNPEFSAEFVLLSIKILFSCEDLPEKALLC
jgi:hypothetical protein